MNPFAANFLRARHPLVWGQFDGQFACGTGWFNVLDYFGCCLAQAPQNFEVGPKVVQVKEKFGELRIYLHPQVPQYVHLAQVCRHMARSICEICGEPGEFSVSLSTVPEARCDRHVDAKVSPDEPVPFGLRSVIPGHNGDVIAEQKIYRTLRPHPRLSRVPYPLGDKEAEENRQRLRDELEFLIEEESLSNQQLALLCVAQSALDLARESPELASRLRLRSKLLARHSGSAVSLDAILASWSSLPGGPS